MTDIVSRINHFLRDCAPHVRRRATCQMLECARDEIVQMAKTIDGVNPFSANPSDWGLRSMVAGLTGQRDAAEAAERRLVEINAELREALVRVLMWKPRSTEAACEQDFAFARAAIAKGGTP